MKKKPPKKAEKKNVLVGLPPGRSQLKGKKNDGNEVGRFREKRTSGDGRKGDVRKAGKNNSKGHTEHNRQGNDTSRRSKDVRQTGVHQHKDRGQEERKGLRIVIKPSKEKEEIILRAIRKPKSVEQLKAERQIMIAVKSWWNQLRIGPWRMLQGIHPWRESETLFKAAARVFERETDSTAVEVRKINSRRRKERQAWWEREK